jgi:diacylglycerol kinase family enzyme
MKLLKTLRNNWKKSVFAFGCFAYGNYYLIERKRNSLLLQSYCLNALKYSKEKFNPESNIKRVTVFLNPIANKERGRFLYDKHIAPLLYLSGLDVRLIRLEKNSEANEYMKALDLNDTDCIVVAGGNATLNEVISGLMNREDSAQFLKRIPIGVLPIGQTNNFSRKWFDSSDNEIRFHADSAMAIIKGETKPANLLKITVNQNEKESESNEKVDEKTGAYSLLKQNKIYALSNFSCGFVTSTDANLDNYWYFGFNTLRQRMNHYFMKRYLLRNPYNYEFTYKNKCYGCSKCLNSVDLNNRLKQVNEEYENVKRNQFNKNLSLFKRLISILSHSRPNSKEIQMNLLKQKEEQMKELRSAIEKSKRANKDCEKIYTSNLLQVQLYANINEQEDEPYIDTVIVKDPKFNFDEMFLAKNRNLKEFQIRRTNVKELDKNQESVQRMAIEIDGEIYKLNNSKENELSLKVELVENCLNIFYLNRETLLESNSYTNSQTTNESATQNQKVSIQPFKHLYDSYLKQVEKLSLNKA